MARQQGLSVGRRSQLPRNGISHGHRIAGSVARAPCGSACESRPLRGSRVAYDSRCLSGAIQRIYAQRVIDRPRIAVLWYLVVGVLVLLPAVMLSARGGELRLLPYGWQMFAVGEPAGEVVCGGELRYVTRDEWMAGFCNAP